MLSVVRVCFILCGKNVERLSVVVSLQHQQNMKKYVRFCMGNNCFYALEKFSQEVNDLVKFSAVTRKLRFCTIHIKSRGFQVISLSNKSHGNTVGENGRSASVMWSLFGVLVKRPDCFSRV